MEEPLSIKLVMVGDGAVGKTCLLQTYKLCHNSAMFQISFLESTIFDNRTTTVKIDNHIIHLGLWFIS